MKATRPWFDRTERPRLHGEGPVRPAEVVGLLDTAQAEAVRPRSFLFALAGTQGYSRHGGPKWREVFLWAGCFLFTLKFLSYLS